MCTAAECVGNGVQTCAVDAHGCVAWSLAACLAPGGTLVTYGLLSYPPVQLPSSLVVFGELA